MRVRLLNNGSYGHDTNVTYPAEVEAVRRFKTLEGVDVRVSELKKVGFDLYYLDDTFELYFNDDEIEIVPTEQTDTPCDITNKCCNQFGERDEIQAIIDKLSAGVAERDERIKALDSKCGELYKLAEELGACSEFLKVNFACSWGE